VLESPYAIDDFVNADDIAQVLAPLRDPDQQFHWLPPTHVYWDYSFSAPMFPLYRALLKHIPDAIPNEAFFFRYSPPHHAQPRIHTDTRFGEDNCIVYLDGPETHGTGFWERERDGVRMFDASIGTAISGTNGWREYQRFDGKHGRAVIHSVDAYHRAFPLQMPSERIIWCCRFYRRGGRHDS
jgi:hypothetical protein